MAKFVVPALLVVVILGSLQLPEAKQYKLQIQERGQKFNEIVEIDEKKKTEVFKVPAHNNIGQVEQMNDFVMKLSISRVHRSKTCYVSKMVPEFESPHKLKKDLERVASKPESHSVVTVSRQWIPVGPYPSHLLRKEARSFCGDFPIVLLKEYTPDSVSVEDFLKTADQRVNSRSRRQTTMGPGCNKFKFDGCNYCYWKLKCRISDLKRVYFVTCNINDDIKTVNCSNKHIYNRIVCCDLVCGKTKRIGCKDSQHDALDRKK